ncbi:ArsR/SmtB family transcription factor [Acerihabitans arboris]|uniref:Helix-turn-helix domain-containing protein n=1 Tax=Acerihabitans arboris TaxID=2691583 RepID=A0A845SL41_9GAMM|nr:metalloregulator ArsR/SmtB family transcription factor [Acerihabitans arboris]NDL64102.1 helix-turn-helix domain-containing protein [Acerihabitans arboris]
MRPIIHPAAEDITVEGILHALSDPLRVHIFTAIARAECSQPCSAFLEFSERSVPKSTLSQHFKILREAGLIRSERKGVEVRNTLRHDDLQERFGALIQAILGSYSAQCARTPKNPGCPADGD